MLKFVYSIMHRKSCTWQHGLYYQYTVKYYYSHCCYWIMLYFCWRGVTFCADLGGDLCHGLDTSAVEVSLVEASLYKQVVLNVSLHLLP